MFTEAIAVDALCVQMAERHADYYDAPWFIWQDGHADDAPQFIASSNDPAQFATYRMPPADPVCVAVVQPARLRR